MRNVDAGKKFISMKTIFGVFCLMSLSHTLFKHLPPPDKNSYYFLNFQPKVFVCFLPVWNLFHFSFN